LRGEIGAMNVTLGIGHYAHDADLIAHVGQQRSPRIRIYRLPDPIIVLGRGSRPQVELQLDACREDRIPILRRDGGGCAVVIDPGDVILAAVLPVDGIGRIGAWYDHLTGWLIEGLAQAGVLGVKHAGICDLVIGDRKIAGASMHQSREVLTYGAVLLVEPRVDLMERYLKHPPREPAYRRGRSHRDFVGALAELAATHPTPAWLEERLCEILTPPPPLI